VIASKLTIRAPGNGWQLPLEYRPLHRNSLRCKRRFAPEADRPDASIERIETGWH